MASRTLSLLIIAVVLACSTFAVTARTRRLAGTPHDGWKHTQGASATSNYASLLGQQHDYDDDNEENEEGGVRDINKLDTSKIAALLIQSPITAVSKLFEYMQQQTQEMAAQVHEFMKADWLLRPYHYARPIVTRRSAYSGSSNKNSTAASKKVSKKQALLDSFKNSKALPTVNGQLVNTGTRQSHRVLQNDDQAIQRDSRLCYANGLKVVVRETYYKCNAQIVTREQYDTRKDTQTCVTEDIYREVCMCPADRGGDLCDQANYIQCKIVSPESSAVNRKSGDRQLSIQGVDCPAYNDVNYVSAYDGDPPCNFYDPNAKYDESMFVTLSCSNSAPDRLSVRVMSSAEEVEVMWSIPVLLPDGSQALPNGGSSDVQFPYFIQEPNLVSSLPVRFAPRVSFIDWTRFSRSIDIEYMDDENGAQVLTFEQITAQEQVEVRIPLSRVPPELALNGRISVEIAFTEKTFDPVQNAYSQDQVSDRRSVYFDDVNWKEPTHDKRRVIAIIVAVVLVIVFVAAGGAFIWYRARKQGARRLQPQPVSDPKSSEQFQ